MFPGPETKPMWEALRQKKMESVISGVHCGLCPHFDLSQPLHTATGVNFCHERWFQGPITICPCSLLSSLQATSSPVRPNFLSISKFLSAPQETHRFHFYLQGFVHAYPFVTAPFTPNPPNACSLSTHNPDLCSSRNFSLSLKTGLGFPFPGVFTPIPRVIQLCCDCLLTCLLLAPPVLKAPSGRDSLPNI